MSNRTGGRRERKEEEEKGEEEKRKGDECDRRERCVPNLKPSPYTAP
jgi:hypothetical protein